MHFTVTVRDTTGLTRTFPREAESEHALAADLRAERMLVLSIERTRETADLPFPWHPAWLKPVTGFDIEMGLRQLASMLRSGMTLLKGLAGVEEQSFSPRAKRLWRRVREKITRGGTFAGALEDDVKRFGEVCVRLAEVGERAGELENAVTRAADQMEARRSLRTAVINALAYPVFAVLMAVGVSVYLVLAVIPKVADFLQSGGTALPAITQSLMDFSAWVQTNGGTILIYLAATVSTWLLIRLHEKGREYEDVLLMRLPITGKILRLSGTALFARSMEIMIASGVTLVDALATAAKLLTNRRLRVRVQTAHDRVIKGLSLGESLEDAREFMPMLRRMASVGEMTGALPEVFNETARFHEMQLALAIKRFGMLIEPVMIIITGLIVGFVYIAFFTAIFAIAGTN